MLSSNVVDARRFPWEGRRSSDEWVAAIVDTAIVGVIIVREARV